MSFFSLIFRFFFGGRLFSPNVSLPDSSDLVSLYSREGEQLLANSSISQDYRLLSKYFVAQEWFSYCGAASMAMVMNAFSEPRSVSPEFDDSDIFTEDNILSKRIERVLPVWKIRFLGMSLKQLGQSFETYPIKSQVYYAESLSLKDFRDIAKLNLGQPERFVAVNYFRQSLKQAGWGHISPLGAYNLETDSFLILDVARRRYPPVWVKAKTLYRAMRTNDFISGKSRGFVVVNKNF